MQYLLFSILLEVFFLSAELFPVAVLASVSRLLPPRLKACQGDSRSPGTSAQFLRARPTALGHWGRRPWEKNFGVNIIKSFFLGPVKCPKEELSAPFPEGPGGGTLTPLWGSPQVCEPSMDYA